MTIVDAEELRNNLFEYLARVTKGETITIQVNGEDLALVVPPQKRDWRSNMRTNVILLGSAEEVFAPMEDLWE